MAETNDEVNYHFDRVVTLEELEKKHVHTAMERAGGNKPAAAAMLGISVKTLYNKLNQYAQQPAKKVEGA